MPDLPPSPPAMSPAGFYLVDRDTQTNMLAFEALEPVAELPDEFKNSKEVERFDSRDDAADRIAQIGEDNITEI